MPAHAVARAQIEAVFLPTGDAEGEAGSGQAAQPDDVEHAFGAGALDAERAPENFQIAHAAGEVAVGGAAPTQKADGPAEKAVTGRGRGKRGELGQKRVGQGGVWAQESEGIQGIQSGGQHGVGREKHGKT